MEIKVANKEAKYNIGFVRKLDKIYKIESKEGISFGMGLNLAVPQLMMGSIVTLVDVLACATGATEAQVEKYLEKYAEENEDFEEIFDGVMVGLKTSPMTKMTTNKVLNATAQAQTENQD